MSISSTLWFLIMPLLSEPAGAASRIPSWLWVLLILMIVGLPILTVIFGPRMRGKPSGITTAPPEHAPVDSQEAQAVPEAPALSEQDDLTRIEGIGPKISQTLHQAGITTFAALGATSVDALAAILAQEPTLRLADPSTWSQQATLADDDDWEGLDKLQAELKGGRR